MKKFTPFAALCSLLLCLACAGAPARAGALPPGVVQGPTLQGVAQSNERVSELLRNLLNNSPWLDHPDLVEIVAGSVALTPKDLRRVSNFTIRAGLVRSSTMDKASAPASSPVRR